MLTHVGSCTFCRCRSVGEKIFWRGESVSLRACSRQANLRFLRRKLERHVDRQIVGIEKTRGAASSRCYPH
eukprot:scaffold19787_cov127-Skeletonema_dohrnii-CCMP3373.AAC.4